MINERIVIEEKTKDYNEAWIETYFWQESEELYPGQKRPVIVICPGGAYCMTSDREALEKPLLSGLCSGMGYHAVVLRYRRWHLPDIRWPPSDGKSILPQRNSDKWHFMKE